MKLKLTEQEQDELLPHIKAVLNGESPWESKEMHHPAGAIIDAILTIKGMAKDEGDEESSSGFATNGWQWDWWQEFTHNSKSYTLSGSGYYGGHSFGPSDE